MPPVEAISLFLDIDGTLAEFKRLPGEVVPTARRTGLLKALCERLAGRVALISGRTLADVDRITEGVVLAASGVHGLERRGASGHLQSCEPHHGIAHAREVFSALVETHPTLVIEDKRLGLVLHYRTAPELDDLANAAAARVAEASGLALQRGDMMAEVRTPGADKGDALRAFMAEAPFLGFAPIYVGDDLTDEHAFDAAQSLGGYGVLVGAPRKTSARYRLEDVEAVLSWLEALAKSPMAVAGA